VVGSVRVYLLVEYPATYIEQERVVTVDEIEATGRTVHPFARWLTREELLAAPEDGAVAEALRAWRAGDDGPYDEESALLAQPAGAEAEELGRGIQGG
jgi:hypoxanthine phosphoribosyltransferase